MNVFTPEDEFYAKEMSVAKDALERYSGSPIEDFQPYLLLTNFPKYVDYFSQKFNAEIKEGSMFKVAHCPEKKVSILDFKIGSPAAAFVIDLCSHMPFQAVILLGMCGGLRRHYKVGDFFVPIASVRKEETSAYYFPAEVPALANFVIQKAVTNVLEQQKIDYHLGITYTTNIRFWEFNQKFKENLAETRAQAIEMECATLFCASYRYKLPLGALLLVSDLPLNLHGIKTKASSEQIFKEHTAIHVDIGVEVLESLQAMPVRKKKGMYRGPAGKDPQKTTDSTVVV